MKDLLSIYRILGRGRRSMPVSEYEWHRRCVRASKVQHGTTAEFLCWLHNLPPHVLNTAILDHCAVLVTK